jgi:hypothetical protein
MIKEYLQKLRNQMPSCEYNFLYRFRSNAEFYLDELKDNYLYFSTLEDLNDPLEAGLFRPVTKLDLSMFRRGISSGMIANIQTMNEMMVHEYVCTDCKELGETRSLQSVMMAGFQIRMGYYSKLYTQHLRVSCLTPEIHSMIMWAHYGNSFKGIAIAYHRAVLDEMCKENKNLRIRPVNYLKPRRFRKHDGKTVNLYEKSSYWKYENEVRIVSENLSSEKYKLPKHAVHSVVVGYKCKHIEEINKISTILFRTSCLVAFPNAHTGRVLLIRYSDYKKGKKLGFTGLDGWPGVEQIV